MSASSAGHGTGRHRNRWRWGIWSVAGLLLLLPYIAMQFTTEVDWTASDFVFFAAMLGAAGLAYEMAVRRTSSTFYRAGIAVALAAAFLLIWVNLAVGIIGGEANPANLLYGGVLLVALAGAGIARLRPPGMARAMVATAVAQGLVAVVALLAGWGQTFLVTAFFGALWLLSAGLFRRVGAGNAGRGGMASGKG